MSSNIDSWGGTHHLKGGNQTLTLYGYGSVEYCYAYNWNHAIQMVDAGQTLHTRYEWRSDAFNQQRVVSVNVWGKKWGRNGEVGDNTINLGTAANVYTRTRNTRNLKINIGGFATNIYLSADGGDTTIGAYRFIQFREEWDSLIYEVPSGNPIGTYIELKSNNHNLTLGGNRQGDVVDVWGWNDTINVNGVTGTNIRFSNGIRSNHNATVNINYGQSQNIDFSGVTDRTNINVNNSAAVFVRGATQNNNNIALSATAYVVLAAAGQTVNVRNQSSSGGVSVHANADNSTVNIGGGNATGGSAFIQGANIVVNVTDSNWNTYFNGDYGNGDVRTWTNRVVNFNANNLWGENVYFNGNNNTVNINGTGVEVNVFGSYGGTVNMNTDNCNVNINGVGQRVEISGDGSGTVNMNAANQYLVVASAWQKTDNINVKANNAGLWINGDRANVYMQGDNIAANIHVFRGETNIYMKNSGQTLNVTRSAPFSGPKPIVTSDSAYVTINITDGHIYVTHGASGEIRINSHTINVNGNGFYANVVNGQVTSISNPGAMSTSGYFLERDGNKVNDSLIVNERDVFNAMNTPSNSSSGFYFDYQSLPSTQIKDTSLSNEWTNKLIAPLQAGHTAAQWATA